MRGIRIMEENRSRKVITYASTKDSPYIVQHIIVEYDEMLYNPEYGNDRICECGHPYYRHFDSWDNMCACGCKYCACDKFEESKE
jgi:hypothetical protein